MRNLFPGFPDEAKLWVYAFGRPFSDQERALVTEKLSSFVAAWNSHGVPVRGAFEIVEDRFILIAGHVDDGVSGCSTDSMVRVMKELREAGLDGFDRSLVFFRDARAAVQALKRPDFQEIVAAGQVDAETPVFDPTIQFVGDLRRGGFETAFNRSWHSRAFP